MRHKDDGQELYIMGNVKLIEEDGELMYQRFLFDVTAKTLRDKREREDTHNFCSV